MSDEKKGTKDELVKSQSQYTGNTHFDYVDVTIIKDGDYYKEGDKDRVHPTLAFILEKKGLIAKGFEKNIKTKDTEKILTDVQVLDVLDEKIDLDANKIK